MRVTRSGGFVRDCRDSRRQSVRAQIDPARIRHIRDSIPVELVGADARLCARANTPTESYVIEFRDFRDCGGVVER